MPPHGMWHCLWGASRVASCRKKLIEALQAGDKAVLAKFATDQSYQSSSQPAEASAAGLQDAPNHDSNEPAASGRMPPSPNGRGGH